MRKYILLLIPVIFLFTNFKYSFDIGEGITMLESTESYVGDSEINYKIYKYSYKHNLNFKIALIKRESGFDPLKVNKNYGSKDLGLCQINNKYHKLNNYFDVDENLDYGLKYFKNCLDKAGYLKGAIIIYNAGLTNYRNGIVPRITKRHIKNIERELEYLKGV